MIVILESKFNIGDFVSVGCPCDRLRHQEITEVRFNEHWHEFQYLLKGFHSWCNEIELEKDI